MLRWYCLPCVALSAALVCLSCEWAWAQQRAADQNAAPSPDEQALHQSAVKFVEAYNARDAKAIAELFGPEARMEEADGLVAVGRDAIQEAFAAAFEESPQAAISVSMDSIRFVTPDVAVEEGSTEYFPDGETLTSRSRYIVAHLKQDGAWRMISVRTLDREVLSSYEHLRELEWLVGDWIDEGADAVIETSCRWDENKSFLVQDFQVVQDGEVTLKGTQRIGWDPQARQFRAWIFDSEGGFGEARWTHVEGQWVVKASGVAAGGTAASATRTLTQLDSDHIVLGTSDRVVGNERLPDFEVTMVRKAPQPQDAAGGQ